MTTQQWVADYLEAWNSDDGVKVGEWVTDDCVYEDVMLGQSHKGRKAIAEFADHMNVAFSDDARFDLVSAFSTDDFYYGEWTISGTHNGTQGPFPPTGKHFKIRGVSVGTREAGKITGNRDYWDMVSFLVQVGLAPSPGG